jgi:hypothetical protein
MARPTDHLRARRDLAVVLAGAEDVVAGGAAALVPALHVAGLPRRHADLRHHETDRALLAHHRGDDRIRPAVLGRHHEPVGLQVTHGELSRPRGVVHLHRDEGRLEVARQPLRLVQVIDRRPRLERVVRPRDGDALLADGLDLLRPRIDQGHVVSRTREEPAEIAADRARADEEHLHGAHSPCEDAECTTTEITSGPRRLRARERCADV